MLLTLHGLGRQRIRRDHRVHPWLLRPLYAIANGPASLDTPLPPLSLATFQLPAFLLGIALLRHPAHTLPPIPFWNAAIREWHFLSS